MLAGGGVDMDAVTGEPGEDLWFRLHEKSKWGQREARWQAGMAWRHGESGFAGGDGGISDYNRRYFTKPRRLPAVAGGELWFDSGSGAAMGRG